MKKWNKFVRSSTKVKDNFKLAWDLEKNSNYGQNDDWI